MTRKQYEDMRTIMQFGRLFADAMYRAMGNAGLLSQDFQLQVAIDRVEMEHRPGDALIESVEICKCPSRNDNWQDGRMVDFKFVNEGWVTNADPIIKSGAVPPTVRTAETARRVYPDRKADEKPFAPDGLWLSSRDYYPDVDGGV